VATLSAKFDYDWVINPIVDFFGKLTALVADGTGAFDRYGIDHYLVDGIPGVFNWFGGQLRLLQTGRAQNYLLILWLASHFVALPAHLVRPGPVGLVIYFR
jgi:hypothetical protein